MMRRTRSGGRARGWTPALDRPHAAVFSAAMMNFFCFFSTLIQCSTTKKHRGSESQREKYCNGSFSSVTSEVILEITFTCSSSRKRQLLMNGPPAPPPPPAIRVLPLVLNGSPTQKRKSTSTRTDAPRASPADKRGAHQVPLPPLSNLARGLQNASRSKLRRGAKGTGAFVAEI